MTGMTSQHTNPETHRRRANFSGLIRDAFRLTDDEVYWQEPSVLWEEEYLDQFDAVLVGVSPLSSLGANRAYGALNVITRLWNSGRLTLLVDAPDPVKIESSVQAIVDNPDNLAKDFFEHRKQFRLTKEKEHLDRIWTGVYLLRTQPWPNTIFPTLPWQWPEEFLGQLRNTKLKDVRLLNLDSFLFERASTPDLHRRHWWSYEPGSKPAWLERQLLTHSVHELPTTHRVPTNELTIRQLATSQGTLIAPSKSGTWWSPRYAMSLNQGTAVFSDWHETKRLDDSWEMLPTAYELLSPEDRKHVAASQALTYRAATPDQTEALGTLYSALNVPRKADSWTAG